MKTGDVLAVVSQSGPTVSFFDAITHEPLGAIEVPAEPHELCFDPENRLLYCTIAYRSGYYGDNAGPASEVVVIDADARKVADIIDIAPEHGPHGLALDAANRKLYVSVEEGPAGPGGVIVLDTRNRKQIGRIDTGAPGPHWFVISPDGSRGYAANKEAPFVSVADLESGRLLDQVPVASSEGIAVSPDGKYVCVATPKADADHLHAPTGIEVIDTATNTVVRTIPTENPVFSVHITITGVLLVGELRLDGGTGFGQQGPGRLLTYASGTFEPLGSAEVGTFPLTITSSADGTRAYVSGVVSSTVSVIDLETQRTLATLPIDRLGDPGAHGLAYMPGRG